MAPNKQQFTRNQRVREITHQCGARFSVKANILGLDGAKATVLRMKIRSPRNPGGSLARFDTWEDARKSSLQN